MDLRILIKILGGLLVLLGALILVPAAYGIIYSEHSAPMILGTSLSTSLLGSVLWFSRRNYFAEVTNRTGFAVVTFSWMAASIVGAMPYYLSAALPGFLDSLFESVSGFTGTGASVFSEVESLDKSILLWRSMTQWLGGMGIIVFFIAILPILGVGGVQLFRAETPGPQADKLTPRVRETAKKLWLLYTSLTLILAALLYLAGMSLFDAINHSFTTLSTGGFSTRNTGLAYYNSAAIDYILILFMLIGSINFSLHFRLIAKRELKVFFNTELKYYLGILLIVSIIMTCSTWGANYATLSDSIRYSLFEVVATGSSTGFAHADYIQWPVVTHALLILLMVMGGMSGSTAGGLKCIRMIAAFKHLGRELNQVIHPRAVLTVKVNKHSIPTHVLKAIWGLIFLYFLVFSIATILLTSQNIDLVSSSSAVFSALSNIGPALGDFGPTSNYAALSGFSKSVLCACMLLGRLEFYCVLVIFTTGYWRK